MHFVASVLYWVFSFLSVLAVVSELNGISRSAVFWGFRKFLNVEGGRTASACLHN